MFLKYICEIVIWQGQDEELDATDLKKRLIWVFSCTTHHVADGLISPVNRLANTQPQRCRRNVLRIKIYLNYQYISNFNEILSSSQTLEPYILLSIWVRIPTFIGHA